MAHTLYCTEVQVTDHDAGSNLLTVILHALAIILLHVPPVCSGEAPPLSNGSPPESGDGRLAILTESSSAIVHDRPIVVLQASSS